MVRSIQSDVGSSPWWSCPGRCFMGHVEHCNCVLLCVCTWSLSVCRLRQLCSLCVVVVFCLTSRSFLSYILKGNSKHWKFGAKNPLTHTWPPAMKLWFFRLRSIISPDTMSKCKKALRKVRDCQSKNKAHHLNLVQQLLHLESQSVNIENSSGWQTRPAKALIIAVGLNGFKTKPGSKALPRNWNQLIGHCFQTRRVAMMEMEEQYEAVLT